MIGPGYDRNVYIIPVVAGEGVNGQLCQLVSRTVPIKGVTVDNQNSDVTVLIYPGTSPNGTPYPVAKGKSASIAIDGPFGVWIGFEGTATKDGVIYIAVSPVADELFSAATVGIDNTQGPVDVNVVSSTPPAGSQRILYSERLAFTSSSTSVQLATGPGIGAGLALSAQLLAVRGAGRQPFVQWRFQTRGDDGAYHTLYSTWGDDRVALLNAPAFNSSQGVYFELYNVPAVLGTLTMLVTFNGYYAPPG